MSIPPRKVSTKEALRFLLACSISYWGVFSVASNGEAPVLACPDDVMPCEIPIKENIYSATVCLRFFSELRIREQSLFSMSTVYNGDCNGLNLILERGQYKACLNETDISFPGMPHEQSDWNSICGTYDSQRGLIQLWVNGKRSLAKRFRKGGLTGSVETPHVVLGQRSQSFNTDYFNWHKSFIGELTDLHMWDFVLSPCEIHKYMKGSDFPLGKVINWKAIHGFTKGSRPVHFSRFLAKTEYALSMTGLTSGQDMKFPSQPSPTAVYMTVKAGTP
ncbi:hypothetical protein JZ751_028695, partial [Albula glossodonta]